MQVPQIIDALRRRRAVRARTGALLLVGAALPLLFGSAAGANTRSPCEDGSAVGEICHHLAIVSEGPDYDATMSMIYNVSGLPAQVPEWNEHNPKYTRWYWRYDESFGDEPDIHLHLRIVVHGALTGIETDLPGGYDTCYQIRKATKAIDTVTCPQSGTG